MLFNADENKRAALLAEINRRQVQRLATAQKEHGIRLRLVDLSFQTLGAGKTSSPVHRVLTDYLDGAGIGFKGIQVLSRLGVCVALATPSGDQHSVTFWRPLCCGVCSLHRFKILPLH